MLNKQHKKRKAIGNLALIVIGVSFALILGELGARLLGPPFEVYPNEMRQCDRSVGWRGRPNLTTEINVEGYQHQVIRNSQGMHDTDHQAAKNDNVFRILMLGDSFVDAVEVAEHETSHQRLEDILNDLASPKLKFEVINAGMAAWGPAQELLYFRTEGRAYAPDLVLALWVPANDLLDILPDYALTYGGVNCYAPYFAVCEGAFDPEPWFSAPGLSPTWRTCSGAKKALTAGLNLFYNNSRLYQRLGPSLTSAGHRLEYSHPYAPWIEDRATDEGLLYAYELTKNLYTSLIDEAQQIGAATGLVIISPKQAVFAEIDPSLVAQIEPELSDVLNPTLPHDVFLTLMADQPVKILDLHPAFVAQTQTRGEPLFWEVDSHWNIAGNQVAAETMAKWLIEEGLLPF